MSGAIIEAVGLYKDYSGFAAVKGIDFGVEKGECLGFLGPNGAGKTTTMNMVQGYSPVTSGRLTLFGMDLENNARAIKARIGVVPQENNLDPDLTVLENLKVYARYFDIPKAEALKRATRLLEFMALTDKKDEKITKLSGGMKRRLLIARALVNDPELIMLDEPTTGLDPQARHMIWQSLRSLKREGRTLVLSTHFMDEAAQLCDRLIVMDEGMILAAGTPDALLARYVTDSVVEVRLLEDGPNKVQGCLAGMKFEYEVSGDTMFIYPEDAEAVMAKAGCFPAGFMRRQATLEDVFLKLTGRGLRE